MKLQHSSWSTLAFAVVVMGSLLACKKKTTGTSGTGTTATTGSPTTPTATATATTNPVTTKTFNVGDTADAGEYKITVENVKECKAKPYMKPTKGSIWLGVEVTIVATGDKQIYPGSTNMKAVDKEGHVLKQVGYGAACEPALGYQALGKDEKTKGWVVFEVPSDASGLKFSYNPVSYPPLPSVKYDLGR
jgi:hypothetical protein